MKQAGRTLLTRIRMMGQACLTRRAVACSLPIVLCLIAAAAPLAQATRLVEIQHARSEQSPRYAWVLAAEVKAPPVDKSAPDGENKTSDAPRLIQVLTDNWDVSSGVHLPAIDVPQPVWALCLAAAAPARIAELRTTVRDTGPPLRPTSRGPPVL